MYTWWSKSIDTDNFLREEKLISDKPKNTVIKEEKVILFLTNGNIWTGFMRDNIIDFIWNEVDLIAKSHFHNFVFALHISDDLSWNFIQKNEACLKKKL